ncbi:MAG: M28 family peptidase [Elusimicrobia bacterium]|nr:M28 family peptidase [Elusimicrobiota bacterium]
MKVLSQDIGERNWNQHSRLGAARDYISSYFSSLGFRTEWEEYEVLGKTCHNVVATLPGTCPDRGREIVIVGGHYDSAPGTPGADDNASGVALLMELARRFRGQSCARTVRFVAFSTEEAELFHALPRPERLATMGSFHHARETRRRGDRVAGMISLEMLGYFTDQPGSQKAPAPLNWLYPSRGNFALVVGDFPSAPLMWRLKSGMGLGPSVQGACLPRFVRGVENSDHVNFWKMGYPAVMLTDTAFYRNSHYHTSTDTHEKLDYEKMSLMSSGLWRAVTNLAGRPPAMKLNQAVEKNIPTPPHSLRIPKVPA